MRFGVSAAMDEEAVLAQVKKTVLALSGVISMTFLDADFRAEIINLEMEAEKNGACGGLMPFTNRGVWESFKRRVQFVMVVQSSAILIGDENDLVYIEDQKGQRVGEWINADRQKELAGRQDICYISPDFVLYPDVQSVGEPFFVLPEMDFPYIKNIAGVTNVTSGSVSTLADDYIRHRLGFSNTKHWTHLVGFDLKLE